MARKPNIKLRIKKPAIAEPVEKPKAAVLKTKPSPLPIDIDELAKLKQGQYYRPRKQAISIRLDADVLDWFKSQPGKYQAEINKACRIYMRLHEMQEESK